MPAMGIGLPRVGPGLGHHRAEKGPRPRSRVSSPQTSGPEVHHRRNGQGMSIYDATPRNETHECLQTELPPWELLLPAPRSGMLAFNSGVILVGGSWHGRQRPARPPNAIEDDSSSPPTISAVADIIRPTAFLSSPVPAILR